MGKIIVLILLLCFVFMPGLFAIMVPVINSIVPPLGTEITFSFNELYITCLAYFAGYFLIACWAPYIILLNLTMQNRIFRLYVIKSLLLIPLQFIAFLLADMTEGFFNQGNGHFKTFCYIVVTSLILGAIPDDFLLAARNSKRR